MQHPTTHHPHSSETNAHATSQTSFAKLRPHNLGNPEPSSSIDRLLPRRSAAASSTAAHGAAPQLAVGGDDPSDAEMSDVEADAPREQAFVQHAHDGHGNSCLVRPSMHVTMSVTQTTGVPPATISGLDRGVGPTSTQISTHAPARPSADAQSTAGKAKSRASVESQRSGTDYTPSLPHTLTIETTPAAEQSERAAITGEIFDRLSTTFHDDTTHVRDACESTFHSLPLSEMRTALCVDTDSELDCHVAQVICETLAASSPPLRTILQSFDDLPLLTKVVAMAEASSVPRLYASCFDKQGNLAYGMESLHIRMSDVRAKALRYRSALGAATATDAQGKAKTPPDDMSELLHSADTPSLDPSRVPSRAEATATATTHLLPPQIGSRPPSALGGHGAASTIPQQHVPPPASTPRWQAIAAAAIKSTHKVALDATPIDGMPKQKLECSIFVEQMRDYTRGDLTRSALLNIFNWATLRMINNPDPFSIEGMWYGEGTSVMAALFEFPSKESMQEIYHSLARRAHTTSPSRGHTDLCVFVQRTPGMPDELCLYAPPAKGESVPTLLTLRRGIDRKLLLQFNLERERTRAKAHAIMGEQSTSGAPAPTAAQHTPALDRGAGYATALTHNIPKTPTDPSTILTYITTRCPHRLVYFISPSVYDNPLSRLIDPTSLLAALDPETILACARRQGAFATAEDSSLLLQPPFELAPALVPRTSIGGQWPQEKGCVGGAPPIDEESFQGLDYTWDVRQARPRSYGSFIDATSIRLSNTTNQLNGLPFDIKTIRLGEFRPNEVPPDTWTDNTLSDESYRKGWSETRKIVLQPLAGSGCSPAHQDGEPDFTTEEKYRKGLRWLATIDVRIDPPQDKRRLQQSELRPRPQMPKGNQPPRPIVEQNDQLQRQPAQIGISHTPRSMHPQSLGPSSCPPGNGRVVSAADARSGATHGSARTNSGRSSRNGNQRSASRGSEDQDRRQEQKPKQANSRSRGGTDEELSSSAAAQTQPPNDGRWHKARGRRTNPKWGDDDSEQSD